MAARRVACGVARPKVETRGSGAQQRGGIAQKGQVAPHGGQVLRGGSRAGGQKRTRGQRQTAPPQWPRVVAVGNSRVRVYQTAHPRAKGGFVYVIAWSTPEGRKRKGFTSEGRALAEARVIAEQLNSGFVQSTSMSAAEREEWVVARSIAGEKGLPLVSAMREWQSAFELTEGRLLDAARAWAAKVPRGHRQVSVQEAIDLYLKAQRAKGVKTRAGAERTLSTRHSTAGRPSFQSHFGTQSLAEVTPDALSEWLELHAHPVTRNSHRKWIVALWRWCQRRGYLPLDTTTAAERTDRAQEAARKVGLISAGQLQAAFSLICAEHPHYVPLLALTAFCGMRSFEVHGQCWEDFDWERRFLRVSTAKPNTPARRQVPLCDTALAWLSPHRQPSGPICSNLGIYRIRDICQKQGIALAENGFRHTWISARVELTGDIPRTALEAGTSVSMIHQHYRELLRPEEAVAWFAVTPDVAAAHL